MIYEILLLLFPLSLIILLLTFFAINTATGVINRSIIIILLIGGLSISFLSFNNLLSRPKSASIEWLYKNIKEVEILSATLIANEALYVWIKIPGIDEPRYYKFDWDEKKARALQKVLRQKAASGGRGKIKMQDPFKMQDNSIEQNKVKFNAIERQLPLKPYEGTK